MPLEFLLGSQRNLTDASGAECTVKSELLGPCSPRVITQPLIFTAITLGLVTTSGAMFSALPWPGGNPRCIE